MSLPPLPPGWTRERVHATPETEMAALPDAEFNAISAFLAAEGEAALAAIRAAQPAQRAAADASRAAAGLPSLDSEDAAVAAQMGLRDLDLATQSDLFRVAKTMHGVGAESWGFVVIKTWGYRPREKARWTAFWRRWGELSDAALRAMGAVGDLKVGFAGRLKWFLVEDEERLGGKSIDEARKVFAELIEEEGRIPDGIDLDLCLVIDAEVVASLLDENIEEAFVIGVDVNGEEEAEDGSGDEELYPGSFKIAVGVLIPELWEILQRQAPYELYPGQGEIYRGIIG